MLRQLKIIIILLTKMQLEYLQESLSNVDRKPQ